MDTLHLDLARGPLSDPVATSMGNPHATFFVEDLGTIDMDALGPELEHDPLFPQRANIGVAQATGPDRLRLRVWERGVGLTLACGSGACAAMAVGRLWGRLGEAVEMQLRGGALQLEWAGEGRPLFMTGPAVTVYRGDIEWQDGDWEGAWVGEQQI
jgi:diaminopimelate epimerase